MPKIAEAPFVIFDPIKYFTDRERQVQAFDRLWHNPSPWVLFLYGMSGNGKSTFMRYVIATRCRPQKLAYTQLYLDSPEAATDRFVMAATLAEGLREHLPAKIFDRFEQQRNEILAGLQNQRANLRSTQIVKAEAGATIRDVQQDAVVRLARELDETAYRRLANAFVELAGALPERVVFFLDGYEALQRTGDRGLSGWLWNVLERCQKHCPGLRVVVGCQDAPQLPIDYGVVDDDLAPFQCSDTQQLFRNLQISVPQLAEAVHKFTQGHPLLVAMAAQEALAGHLTLAEIRQAIDDNRRAEEWLFQRVIGRLPEPHRSALPWLALLRRFNHDGLNHLLAPRGITFSEKDFRVLQQFSFVRYDKGWWRCHDLIRRTQQRYYKEAQPQTTHAFYEGCWQYHEGRWQAKRQEADRLDALYYLFLLSPERAYVSWHEALLEAKQNWRREFWGELVKVADEAFGFVSGARQADFAYERGNYGRWQYDMTTALDAYNHALSLFKQVGYRLGEANTLKAIGDVHQFKKDLAAALDAYNHALSLFKQVGSRLGEANVYQSLGNLYHAQLQFQQARIAFETALALHNAIADRYSVASDLHDLSFTLQSLGQAEAAVQALETALRTCWEIDIPWSDLVIERLFDLKNLPEDEFDLYLSRLAQPWGLGQKVKGRT